MEDAAFVARLFHLDPVAVLNSDPDGWAVRLAAARAAIRQIGQEA